MALSMYDVSVPTFQQLLGGLSEVIDKAAAHCAEKKIEPAALITARLFPNMYTFARQVQATTQHATNVTARLIGQEPPALPEAAASFDDLKARVAKALEYLASIKPDQMQGSETKDIEVKRGTGPMIFSGRNFLFCFVLPNFYFHVTTAYDILRHNGVVLAKSDFMGSFQPK
jgi:uncharacterized protein